MRVNYDSVSLLLIASFPCCLPLGPISLSSRPFSLSTPWPTWKLGSACRETEVVRPSGFRKTPWGQGPGTRLASAIAEAAQGTGGEQGDTRVTGYPVFPRYRLDAEGTSSQPWASPVTSEARSMSPMLGFRAYCLFTAVLPCANIFLCLPSATGGRSSQPLCL